MQTLCSTLLVVLVCGAASAQSLDGRAIRMKSGAVKSLHVPLTLPYDGPEVDGNIAVVEDATGRAFPATLRGGELVFVPEGAMPGSEHRYTVKVLDKDAAGAPKVVLKKQDGKDAVDVIIEGLLFTTYHHSNEYKKPFLWPVMSQGQVGVTRNFPMSDEGIPKYAQDHPHHKSLWAAYGEVNMVDCWGEGRGSGFQHSDEVTWGSGNAYGWIKAKNVWQDKDHKPVVTEEREYRFYATPENARLIDSFVTFTADYGDANFTDTKEGGIVAVRMRPELSYRNAVITNALGDKGEEQCWGKPSPWCDYAGEMDDVGWRGLAVFDHPGNLRHPTSWHVRKYGLMGANCFGYSYFGEKDYNKGLLPVENGDYLIKKGESLSFKHRIYVHSGDAETAAVAGRYADYATPPEVAWAE